MGSQEHFERHEYSIENREPSKLEATIKHGEELAIHFEHQNSHIAVDLEALPNDIDKNSLNEKLSQMQQLEQDVKTANLAAEFLKLTNNTSPEGTPKDFEVTPQTPDASLDSAKILQHSTMVLEVVGGVAKAALEQQKKDAKEVIEGVDTNGKEVGVRDRVEKAVNLVPSKIPKLGPLAAIISNVMEIQKDISEAKPGYIKKVALRTGLLLADRVTHGLASFAWELLSPKEVPKKKEEPLTPPPILADVPEQSVEVVTPLPVDLPLEGDGGESDPEQPPQENDQTNHVEKLATTE